MKGAPTVGAAFCEGVSKRRTYKPELQGRLAMGAIHGRKRIQKIAADYGIRRALGGRTLCLLLQQLSIAD